MIPPAVAGGVNGPEIRVLEIFRQWKATEFYPMVLYPDSGKLREDFLECMRNGIGSVRVYPPANNGWRTIRMLISVCRNMRPDLIHSHGPAGLDFCCFLVSRLLGFDSVVSRPVMLSEDSALTSFYRWKLRLLDFFFTRWSESLVAISQKGMKQWERELWFIPGNRKRVIMNGVDLHRFRQKSFPDFQLIRFCTIAQFTSVKGHLYLLEAARKLKLEKRNFEIFLVGDGPLRDMCQKYVFQHGLQDTVNFTGFLKNPETILEQTHVLVLPSLREGVPVSVLESMACGRPVIATDVGAVSEILRNGENGFLIVPADSSAISSAMAKFIDEPNLIREMGHRAFISAQQYSLESMRDGYVKLYKDMLLSVSAPNALGKK